MYLDSRCRFGTRAQSRPRARLLYLRGAFITTYDYKTIRYLYSVATALAFALGTGTLQANGGSVSVPADLGANENPTQRNYTIAADAISVTTFGARCDGVTNDASAFQAAINANPVVAVTIGNCSSNYLINDTVIVPAGHGFVGSSPARS